MQKNPTSSFRGPRGTPEVHLIFSEDEWENTMCTVAALPGDGAYT